MGPHFDSIAPVMTRQAAVRGPVLAPQKAVSAATAPSLSLHTGTGRLHLASRSAPTKGPCPVQAPWGISGMCR